jgi:hypothetical protein
MADSSHIKSQDDIVYTEYKCVILVDFITHASIV